MLTSTLLNWILGTLAIVVLFIASYTDFRKREVPDWLNYGLIFAVLGIRTIFSFELGWNILISGALGFLVCFLLALLFYYTNQWGGGDSKLLMAMGALIGINYPLNQNSWNLLFFFLALLLFGAIYGVFFLVYTAIAKRKIFLPRFKEILKQYRVIHYIMMGLTAFGLILSFFYLVFLPLAIFPLAFFYLLSFVSAVEKKCFLKNISPKLLTEGDWLANDLFANGKKLMEKKTLEIDDLKKIRNWHSEGKIESVMIREGIPFVPSFLIAYLVLLFAPKLFAWILAIF